MELPDSPPPYRTVVFDCDSTLSDMEGIEELAGGEHAERIARWTAEAMDGRIALEEVYGKRLELVQPSRELVAEIGRRYVAQALPNARELLRALTALGKRVVIVSGGLLPAVRSLADELGVDEVHAVDVFFDEAGAYAGFEARSPLARSGGKIDVLGAIAARTDANPIAFVGDGVTDLEAAHLVARFIAYGGVERRDVVFDRARITCDSADYRDLVPFLLSAEEIETLRTRPEFATLIPTPSSR